MSSVLQTALYFCTGDLPEEQWRHYALNVAHYTHFTSPIRRYPDILVHRLLAAALEGQSSQGLATAARSGAGLLSPSELALVAGHCNDRRSSANFIQVHNPELPYFMHRQETVPLASPSRFHQSCKRQRHSAVCPPTSIDLLAFGSIIWSCVYFPRSLTQSRA